MGERQPKSVQDTRTIDLYKGQPLEVFKSRGLLPDLEVSKRLFLPSGVIKGIYGVTGFIIIDKTPEDRFVGYTSDLVGVTWSEKNFEISEEDISHFLNTKEGFKMIRYFALPPSVRSFFERDRFLGDPLIDKCCSEDIPKELDETGPLRLGYAFSSIYEGEVKEMVDNVLLHSNPQLTKDELNDWKNPWEEKAYISFHPWKDFQNILEIGSQSIYAAIFSFDRIIQQFDTNHIMKPRELTQENTSLPSTQ